MSAGKKQEFSIKRNTSAENAAINRDALSDPDNLPIMSDEDLKKLVPLTGEEFRALIAYKQKIEAMGKRLVVLDSE